MSCNNNKSTINQTFIIEPLVTTASTTTLSACTGFYTNNVISCSGDAIINLLSGETSFNTSISPVIDNTIDLGFPIKRFRNVNTISGTSTVWTSTERVITPILDLGIDSYGFVRQITADNSVIAYDELNGGIY